jgi:phosphate transport system substrate-binding protein
MTVFGAGTVPRDRRVTIATMLVAQALHAAKAAAPLLVLSCTVATAAAVTLHGAGATFPAPLYEAWGTAYALTSGVEVVYDAVGSGLGIERLRSGQVDFGASDAPLSAQELRSGGLLEFPVVVGGVVPVVNITGIPSGRLKLTGRVLADIYLGSIRRWNDAAIAELNPDITLPSAHITVVHRSDASGSSLLWTDYLSRSSETWRSRVGVGLTPRWPRGVAASGNEGVASYVERTRFALGYVEFYYARRHGLSDAALRNHEGHFVRAGPDAFRAAAQAVHWTAVESMGQLPTDAPGSESWPITGASFILVGQSASAREVLRFFHWALHEGTPIVSRLEYVPVPQSVLDQLPHVWGAIRDREGKPVWP